MPKFIPGLKLSQIFFEEAVKPIIESDFPKLKYSAALIGWGSEVLGFDTEISTDHHWGPRVLIFLSDHDLGRYKLKLKRVLSQKLPLSFLGYPTNFSFPDNIGVRHMVHTDTWPVNHMVDIFSLRDFSQMRLGIDLTKKLNIFDWLLIPQQRLLEITSGGVFRDDLGLKSVRKKFNYYPKDIWLFLFASQWKKISQEEAFVGRASEVGDELGSQIVATRLVRELMRLCFLIERKYIPYTKWFGRAFSNLHSAKKLTPLFKKVLSAASFKEREKYLSRVYIIIAKMYNRLGIIKSLSIKPTFYYGRPYMVIGTDRFADETRKAIKEKQLKNIKLIGSIDQFSDNTDLVSNIKMCRKLKQLFF